MLDLWQSRFKNIGAILDLWQSCEQHMTENHQDRKKKFRHDICHVVDQCCVGGSTRKEIFIYLIIFK